MMNENRESTALEDTSTDRQSGIVLAQSGLGLADGMLVKCDALGNKIAELSLKDVYSAKAIKRVDKSFLAWLTVAAGAGASAYYLIENTIVSGILYTLGVLIALIGLSSMISVKIVLERKGDPLVFTVSEDFEEAKAFAESLMEKRTSM